MQVLIRHTSTTDPLSLEIVKMPYTDKLEDLQRLVGGWIEALSPVAYFPFLHLQVIGWCNEEGKLHGLLPTLPVLSTEEELLDVILGNIVITGVEGPDTKPLTEEEADMVIKDLARFYSRFNFKIRY